MYALGRAVAALAEASPEAGGERPLALVEAPSYASYRDGSEAAGLAVRSVASALPGPALAVPEDEERRGEERYALLSAALAEAPRGSILWLGAPNNPTGNLPPGYPSLARRLAAAFPDRYLACDEAFIEFCDGADARGAALAEASALDNLVILRSMTKFWAVPGLRVGYALACPALAAAIRAELPNWPVNAVAEAFARRAFSDPGSNARREATRTLVAAERRRMAQAIDALPGLEALASSTNYYLIRAEPSAGALADALAARGIGVRRCDNFEGLGDSYLRLAVRTPAENDAILEALTSIAEPRGLPGPRAERRAKALMIQGCSSGAGKSLVAAAFCRIFRDRGLDVAPYKAQNMSLNSAVTADGLELGRAQAVQAAACGLEPDVRMNPVLLKPESDRGSQIVLMGRPYARREARDYYAMHETMRDAARAAYDSLAAERELIVLEGAGSPAEINLKRHDFVNMGAARYAGARDLLVGDIDRGGVFASFIGHVATFAPEELRLLSGFIVNKFRGDPALLGDAFAMTAERTGYPVLGCVPMVPSLDIPDEDEAVVKAGPKPGAVLRIAVPRLRRVSNFTDLDAFAAEPDVEVVPLSRGDELAGGGFDAVVIPGTKSTVADLAWLRDSGLAEAISRFAANGGTVVGICGGYQMLGSRILDPDGVESASRETAGLGLLPVETCFSRDKTLLRTRARWLDSGEELEGYEIHHGDTRLIEGAGAPGRSRETAMLPAVVDQGGRALGYRRGAVWGSYLHGLFDADGFRRSFLNGLRQRRGLAPLAATARSSLDAELARLAQAVEANVELGAILAELGL